MKTASFLALPLLLTGAFAGVLSRRAVLDSGFSWIVTNYTQGCSLGGCVYQFTLATHNISQTEPPFTTTCNGTNVADHFQSCSNPAVLTKEVNGNQNTTLLVQHVFNVGEETRYNITGSYTIPEPEAPSTFEVPELAISAVG